jgi:hypothetical protein
MNRISGIEKTIGIGEEWQWAREQEGEEEEDERKGEEGRDRLLLLSNSRYPRAHELICIDIISTTVIKAKTKI